MAVFRRNVLITRLRYNKARRVENFAGKPSAAADCEAKETKGGRRGDEGLGQLNTSETAEEVNSGNFSDGWA